MSKKQDYKKFMQVEAGDDQHIDTDFYGNIFSAEAGCILKRDEETTGETLLKEEAKAAQK